MWLKCAMLYGKLALQRVFMMADKLLPVSMGAVFQLRPFDILTSDLIESFQLIGLRVIREARPFREMVLSAKNCTNGFWADIALGRTLTVYKDFEKDVVDAMFERSVFDHYPGGNYVRMPIGTPFVPKRTYFQYGIILALLAVYALVAYLLF